MTSSTNDKEKYTCFECALAGRDAGVTLDTNGRCGVCHSDAVLSKHQTETLAMRSLQRTPPLQDSSGVVQDSKTQGARIIREERVYYKISSGVFETVVSWQDATSLEQAIDIAFNSTHPWYSNTNVQTVGSHQTLSHSQFCDWLRKH